MFGLRPRAMRAVGVLARIVPALRSLLFLSIISTEVCF